MNQTQDKEYLFERMPVPGAVMQLSLPIVISSLVTILYNLADTFFVGMLNNPVENAAVTLVYPVTLVLLCKKNENILLIKWKRKRAFKKVLNPS